ncbi:MAG: aldehyde dehydrogenase family protein [Spirochaetaceae bacterium]
MNTYKGPTGHFIDGEFVFPEEAERIAVVNPADRSVVTEVPDGREEDVDRAVASALRAYRQVWRRTTQREKGRYLLAISRRLEERAEELAQLETLENGKPIAQSRMDVGEAIRNYRYYGGLADKIHGITIPERDGLFDYTVREPYGIVGSIIPWNWPPMHTADFTAAPLAAGNVVIIKPAPETPLSTLAFAEIWQEILPPGVVSVVTGAGTAGIRLTTHPEVRKIAFTGHDATGAKVAQAAGTQVKSVMLELGGKNANIVLPDADLDAAATGAVQAFLKNTGQACTAGSRLLVHENIYDDFMPRVRARLEQVRIGLGTDESNDLATLASERQYTKVREYIEIGKQEGATVFFEGTLPEGLPNGYFVPPVVFTDVAQSMRICREEIFGPVLTVQKFASVAEAVEMANGTPYGLTAAVWSESMAVANRLARELEAGIVFVNNYANSTFLGAPFGGFKKSGIGRKLGLDDTIMEFTQSKTVRTSISPATLDEIDARYR